MKNVKTTLLLLALNLATPLLAGAQSFDVYVSIGDSLAAGFSNGSLVEAHQRFSVPLLIAQQAGVSGSFQQPIVGAPGIPAELGLVSLIPTVVAPVASSPGAPLNLNLNRPYNNLAVPGATAVDALTRNTDGGGLHDLILRGRGTQIAQAKLLRPTFVTLWIGNNDVLGAVVRGRAVPGQTLTPTETFRQVYAAILLELRSTGARIVAANLPDVTTVPFVTTIPPVVVNPTTRQPVIVNGSSVPLLGPNGPLPAGAHVTLAASTLLAQGVGIPAALGGRGTPLPDEVVLDPGEIATIRDHVSTNNQAIRSLCDAAGIPVLDVNGLLGEFASVGREIAGVRVSADFLSGGLFGYDGIHPSDLGYALLANEWIGAINGVGASLPLVDLSPFLGASAAGHARGFEWSDAAWRQLLQALPPLD